MRQELLELQETYHVHFFDGLSDATDYAVNKWDDHVRQHSNTLRSSSTGREFESIRECANALNEPWSQGVEAFDQAMKAIQHYELLPPTNIKRRPIWSEDGGDEVCLDRLRVEQPYWRGTKRDHRPGPANVTIAIDLFTPGYISPASAMWRGVASVVLTKLLEESGYRVCILMADPSRDAYASGRGHISVIELKRPTDYIDTNALINCLSGWCYRTIYFSTMVHEGERLNPWMGNRCKEDVMKHISQDPQSILCSEVWGEQEAVEWVQQQLEKFKTGEYAQQ